MNSAIILCAGNSTRFGKADKLFQKIEKKELIALTIQAFENCKTCNEIIIVCPTEKEKKISKLKLKYNWEKTTIHPKGGKYRHLSVLEGLKSCSKNSKNIAIHDGARPLISPKIIKKAFNLAKIHKAVVCAKKTTDTLKIVENSKIKKHLNREKIFAMETPQIFNAYIIKNAYSKLHKLSTPPTDDATLVDETIKQEIFVYETNKINIKVTTKKDLDFVKFYLKNKR